MSVTAYRTLATGVEHEIVVSRSRFLCTVERVRSEADARNFIASIRNRHWDARHHCSAFVIGADAMLQHANDDGEPSGTAGPPILDALKGADLRDVAAVVTRWFGGTLLGTGGLARAYGDATRRAVAEAEVIERTLQQVCEVSLEIMDVGRIEHALRGRGAHVLGVEYESQAVVRFSVPPQALAVAEEIIAEATGGEAALDLVGIEWVDNV